MVKYVEKSGESIEEAIIILDAESHAEGVASEYEYLEKKYGKRGEDWEVERQALLQRDERYYDRIDVCFSDGTRKSVYFDITSFFVDSMEFFKDVLGSE